MTDAQRIKMLCQMTGKDPVVKPDGKASPQQLYGLTPGWCCRDCIYCVYKQYNRRFYKCKLWQPEKGAATDIRLRDPACGKFEPC